MSDNIAMDVQRDPTSSHSLDENSDEGQNVQVEVIPTASSDENPTESTQMTRGQAIRDFLFGVALPTIDVDFCLQTTAA